MTILYKTHRQNRLAEPIGFDAVPLQWRHNGRDGVSNHQPHHCLLNRLFSRRSKKTSKLRVTDLCAGNSPLTGEFPAQMTSNAENVSIWWRHHALSRCYNFVRSGHLGIEHPSPNVNLTEKSSMWLTPIGYQCMFRIFTEADNENLIRNYFYYITYFAIFTGEKNQLLIIFPLYC